jgi:hypothetical protein
MDHEGRRTLTALATRYQQAAGTAFAQNDDATARSLRDAAGKLVTLAIEIPPLPVTTRGPTPRGAERSAGVGHPVECDCGECD